MTALSPLDAPPVEQLSVYAFTNIDQIAQIVSQELRDQRYSLNLSRSQADFLSDVSRDRQKIDCLILYDDLLLPVIIEWLHQHATLLPTVILQAQPGLVVDASLPIPEQELMFLYHTAEVRLPMTQIEALKPTIDTAIAQFLNLSLACQLPSRIDSSGDLSIGTDLTTQNFLLNQQRRLAEKLKERLGYLGVYYKRNSNNFLRTMPHGEAVTFLNELKESYREIILGYFNNDDRINQKIDTFVDAAFFADLSVAQVVEIHMDLIGEFSKQLRLEGRSEEILTDYRLALIDTLAHLCEMYRRSIPREIPDA